MERCACRGVRSCLLCEPVGKSFSDERPLQHTVYQCHCCGRIGHTELDSQATPLRRCGQPVTCSTETVLKPYLSVASGIPVFQGLTVVKEFITRAEEKEIVAEIDSSEWVCSQSGRLKQDYGPKVNFKKRKVKLGDFSGLPSFSKFLIHRMCTDLDALKGFVPVELCNLDYNPQRGSAIDPHVDDNWIWGERLVTLNLLSHTNLTFTLPPSYSSLVHVPLPRRSLVIVQGSARNEWHHSIQREHICSRRLAVTLRELSKDFLPGGSLYPTVGKDILEVAATCTY